ncbi:MAG: TnsA endonuclease N-terminal domain-containing protein [Nitrospirota bacterium]
MRQFLLKCNIKQEDRHNCNSGIEIPYVTESGNIRKYRPDFLVERIDGTKEIHEIKGRHLLENPDTLRKREAAENWCKRRGMKFILVSKKL